MLFREDDKKMRCEGKRAERERQRQRQRETKRRQTKKKVKKSQGSCPQARMNTRLNSYLRVKNEKERERQKADANIWRITGLTIPMSYHLWEL